MTGAVRVDLSAKETLGSPLPLFGPVVFDLWRATLRESGPLGFAFSNFVDSCEWGFRGRKPLVDSVSRPRFLPKIHNRE